MNNGTERNQTSTSVCMEKDTYFVDVPHNYHIFLLIFSIINAVVAVTATLSNGVVIYTILKTPSLRTPSNILILGLAVSDLCASIITQPCYCLSIIFEYIGERSHFCTAGIVFESSGWMLTSISLLTLTAVTADRFLAIHLHLRYLEHVTAKRCGIVLVFLWTIGVSISICKLMFFSRIIVFLGVVVFVFLIFMNVFFILKISQVIHRHSVQIQAQQQSTQQSIDMPRYKKSVNTMYYVIGAFVVSYLPIGAAFGSFAVVQQMTVEVRGLFKVANTLVMCNGVLNPIIYCWRIDDIRRAALRLLLRR